MNLTEVQLELRMNLNPIPKGLIVDAYIELYIEVYQTQVTPAAMDAVDLMPKHELYASYMRLYNKAHPNAPDDDWYRDLKYRVEERKPGSPVHEAFR